MFDVLHAPSEMSPPPDAVAPEDLVEELASVFAHRDRLDARLAELLRRIGETKAFRRDGFSSLTALLKYRMSIHPGEAQRLVTRANGLTDAPLVALAFETGALSGAQVDVLLEARNIAPEAFAEAEGHLVTVALDTLLIRDLKKQLDYWLDQVAADDLGAERNLVRDLRSLTLRREGEMIRINGWVDIEAGEQLRAELEPGPPAEGDTRSTAARRADVLLDILNGASNRPNITVHVSAETLAHREPGISETAHGTFLTADEIRRLACDANLTRVIFDPESQPLDLAAPNDWSLLPYELPFAPGICDVSSPGATGSLIGAMSITSTIGPTEERPASTTWSCSAVIITSSSTKEDGSSAEHHVTSASTAPTEASWEPILHRVQFRAPSRPRVDRPSSRRVGCSRSSAVCPDSEARNRVAHLLSRGGSSGCHRTRATSIRVRGRCGNSPPIAGGPPSLRGGPDESKPARAIL